jgi:hypothetical protein
MCVRCFLQDAVLSMLLGQLAAVEVEDLPGLVKYLLGSATKANAEQASTHMLTVVCLYISLPAMSGLWNVACGGGGLLYLPACRDGTEC